MLNGTDRNSWLVLAVLAVVGGIAGWKGFAAVSYSTGTTAELGTQLLALIFVALVIERAVEVYVNNRYGRDELLARRDIRLARANLEVMEEAVTREAERISAASKSGAAEAGIAELKAALPEKRNRVADAREQLRQAQAAAQNELEDLRVRKQGTATAIAVFLGLLVSASGVRIFADLVTTGGATVAAAITDDFQLAVFRTADIIVTALLLAGGADGIHQIMNQFLGYDRDIKT